MKKTLLFFVAFVASISYVLSQDITITFSATGESNTVDEVKATNLATQESVTIPGGESLTLTQSTTGINEFTSDKNISVTPNPYGSIARIRFSNTNDQQITLRLASVSGKVILSRQDNLSAGTHQFRVSAARPGLYILSVISGDDIQSIKIIQKQEGSSILEHTGIQVLSKNTKPLKSELAYTLAYTPGDMISYEIKSESNVTVVNETPTESKNVEAEIITCKDYDGTRYKIVKIGTQTWMAENLRSTHYPNGNVIPLVRDDAAWAKLADDNTSDAHCVEGDGEYGALYTYAAAIADNWTRDNADNQGICPDNWHLPSDSEWTILTDYLGGEYYAGGKLKETGTTHWLNPNSGATNTTGFTALPGGMRSASSGSFYYLKETGFFWCSKENSEVAYYRTLTYNKGEVRTVDFEKSMGVSVRCVKD